MVKVPEPDYYPLAEVAEKWDCSVEYLQRLIEEGKLQAATPGVIAVYFVRGAGDVDPRFLTQEEIRDIVPKGTKVYQALPASGPARALAGLCCVHPLSARDGVTQKLIHSYISAMYFLDAHEDWIKAGTLPDDVLLVPCGDTQFSVDEFVIPTTEIHRIEHQHEVAEKATADDALGTKERETMQAIIAGMAQIIAGHCPRFKYGGKPNAAQIADAIVKTGITDRQKETVGRVVSKALKNFGK